MKKIKIEIKDIYGKVLFEYAKENNTIKETVIEAVINGVNLGCACLVGVDLSGVDLRGAELHDADLRGANLINTRLDGANLSGANLDGANLYSAYLREANLGGANLGGANLGGVNLYSAYLREANLGGVNLGGAYLGRVNLGGAYLCGANLSGVNLGCVSDVPYIPLACPSDGAFIGWKKLKGKYLIKLLIPEDAKRTSATSRKCRCSKAQVLDITTLDETEHHIEVTNTEYMPYITYKVGEVVLPDSFDEYRWNECSHGIHFFINKQDAIDYEL